MTNPKTPSEELKQGLGHLFRAAKGFARELNRDLTVSTVEKTVREGATELVRAVASVSKRVSDELEKNFTPPPPSEQTQNHDATPPGGPTGGPDGPSPPPDGRPPTQGSLEGVRGTERAAPKSGLAHACLGSAPAGGVSVGWFRRSEGSGAAVTAMFA